MDDYIYNYIQSNNHKGHKMKIKLKELEKNIPDRITGMETVGEKVVVSFPNGRLVILPDDQKPQMGYSLRKQSRK